MDRDLPVGNGCPGRLPNCGSLQRAVCFANAPARKPELGLEAIVVVVVHAVRVGLGLIA